MAEYLAWHLLVAASLIRPLPRNYDPAKSSEPASLVELDEREAGEVIYFDAPIGSRNVATFLR